jgi:predicted phosphohydrolase
MKYSIRIFSCAIILAFSSCATVPLPFAEKPSERGQTVVIWAHSDIQPRDAEEKTQYECAIDDVRRNIGYIDAAIVAGDIVQAASSGDADADFAWFNRVRAAASVGRWYEISGNHDARMQPAYDRAIKKPLHYAEKMGNLLMIFMSDENGQTSGTEISDKAFNWWRDLVECNQDKIIMTVTHTNLDHAGFRFALLPYRNIYGSKRFEDVLKKYRVDVWLSAHTHTPSKLNMNEVLPGTYGNNTLFLNVASIRRDFFFSNVESRMLLFTKGSPTLTVKTRYHDSETYIDMREFSIRLSHPFEWDGSEPEMIPFKD